MSLENPQLEEGFTPIANSIMEALARTQLSGYEWRVLLFLLRKTYGWSKPSDMISLSQFVDGTGIDKKNVMHTIKKLLDKNIIHRHGVEINPRGGVQIHTMKACEYDFNKHYGQWDMVSKSTPSKKRVSKSTPEVVSKSTPTISIEDTTSRKTTKSEPQLVHHKFKIPHVVFDPMTLQLSGIDDEARRAFSAACPKANLDDCLERLKAWIIKKGVAYENYWRTLCTIGSGDQTRGGTHGTDRKRGYRPSIEDAVFTGEVFVRDHT
jgi:phage replication O-like protein O